MTICCHREQLEHLKHRDWMGQQDQKLRHHVINQVNCFMLHRVNEVQMDQQVQLDHKEEE